MKYPEDIMTVAVVNLRIETGNKEQNISHIKGFLRAAAKRGADLVLFPENCLMGNDYYVNDEVSRQEKLESAEYEGSSFYQEVASLTKKYEIYAVIGNAYREDEALYNVASVFGPEGYIGIYKKIHPFANENTWCVKGDKPFFFDTAFGPIGVGICYDTYQFPELMRYYASKGCRLYLNPTAMYEEIDKSNSRQSFLHYYAPTLEYGVLCNTIFVASANIVGYDGKSYMGGGSCIIGPKTSPFYETDLHYYAGNPDNDQEGMEMATIDLSLAKRILFVDNPDAGEPDYRPQLYKTFE